VSGLIQDAAQIIAPIAAGGTGAIMSGMADEAGANLYRVTMRLIEKIRHLMGRDATPEVVERALSEGVQAGLLEEVDLRAVVDAHASYVSAVNSYSIGSVNAKNAFLGTNNIQNFNG
jgi:hypothetical protein